MERDALVGDPTTTKPAVAPEPFDAFYVRTWDGMVRLARMLIDAPEDAAEVVQEVYVRVYGRYTRIQAEKADAYTRAAVLNGCRRYLRRQALFRSQASPSPSVIDDVGADHVVDAVRRLAADRRDVVVLRYYLDLSEAEIASTLGIPAGTVKSRLHRALNDLAKALR